MKEAPKGTTITLVRDMEPCDRSVTQHEVRCVEVFGDRW
jgi:hypothetical protein